MTWQNITWHYITSYYNTLYACVLYNTLCLSTLHSMHARTNYACLKSHTTTSLYIQIYIWSTQTDRFRWTNFEHKQTMPGKLLRRYTLCSNSNVLENICHEKVRIGKNHAHCCHIQSGRRSIGCKSHIAVTKQWKPLHNPPNIFKPNKTVCMLADAQLASKFVAVAGSEAAARGHRPRKPPPL